MGTGGIIVLSHLHSFDLGGRRRWRETIGKTGRAGAGRAGCKTSRSPPFASPAASLWAKRAKRVPSTEYRVERFAKGYSVLGTRYSVLPTMLQPGPPHAGHFH